MLIVLVLQPLEEAVVVGAVRVDVSELARDSRRRLRGCVILLRHVERLLHKLVRAVGHFGRLRLTESLVGQNVVVGAEDLFILNLELLQTDTLLLSLALGAGRLRRQLLRRLHVMLSQPHIELARVFVRVLLQGTVDLNGTAARRVLRRHR